MHDTPDVISAFLDDEPFDPAALAMALSEPGGREALLDLVALRHLVQPDPAVTATFERRRGSPLRMLAAVAAVLVALVAGYAIGERRATDATGELPSPTRSVEAGAWQAPERRGP